MMDSLIQKYLDGELTEEESRQFLDILASDKEINREVRLWKKSWILGHSWRPLPLRRLHRPCDG